MNCYYHNDKEATMFCSYCGKPLCSKCVKEYNGKVACTDCFENRNLNIEQKQYNSFLAFVFSLVPGAGHMYLGFMKRGIQIMILFFGIIFITDLARPLDMLNILLVVIWFYSFFDCYHLKKKIDRGEYVEDEEIVKSFNFNKYYIGIILLVLGGIALLDQIFEMLNIMINHQIMGMVRNSVFPVLFIIAGLLILYKYKKGGEVKKN